MLDPASQMHVLSRTNSSVLAVVRSRHCCVSVGKNQRKCYTHQDSGHAVHGLDANTAVVEGTAVGWVGDVR